MSTTTFNYGLVKPDLSDAADITAFNQNWDKIDKELNSNKDGLYQYKTKVNEKFAKCNVQSYTTLAQFGLSDTEMSPTDFMSNIDKIVTKLDNNAANLMFIIQSDIHPNLHASIVEKLNADTEISFSTGSHAGWMFIRFSGEMYRPTVIEVNLETANYYDNVWTCVYNKGADVNKMSAFRSNSLYSNTCVLDYGNAADKIYNKMVFQFFSNQAENITTVSDFKEKLLSFDKGDGFEAQVTGYYKSYPMYSVFCGDLLGTYLIGCRICTLGVSGEIGSVSVDVAFPSGTTVYTYSTKLL